MTSKPTARAYLFATIGFVGVAAGAAFSSPELVAIGAPFLVLLAVGLAAQRPSGLVATAEVGEIRSIEGDHVGLPLTVSASGRVPRTEVRLNLPPALVIAEAAPPSIALGDDTVGVSVDGRVELEVDLACLRWGAYELDSITLFTMGYLGLTFERVRATDAPVIKVFPQDETARRLLKPIETQLAYGDLVARQRGQGIEYAELRQMQAGDDLRQVNWRASARSTGMWVNDRHPERNSDVVLFIDTLPEARRGVEPTLDLCVRAIAGLAKMHLRRHDRVGLITFGEPVRWVQPGMAERQRYRILDTLMAARHSRHLYWRGISAIPRQSLPSKALIVAVTPLLDDRIISAIADLHGRGLDVAVIEIPAEHFLDTPDDQTDAIARRIWELGRETTRRRFSRHGVPIAVWSPNEPFERPLMEVQAYRRHMTRARV
ncbi:MAG: DUF58 domain-containing protein [Acidimicrobiia bacterium]|nr:MAG: DUF58 domain-containing protein [Acidimicrobiia bacterium]